MQAITLNKYEYQDHNSRTRKAYRKLIDARNAYYWNQTSAAAFVEAVEIIIYNDIPQSDLIYLKDSSGPYYTILKELFKSLEGGSLYRLKTDLLTVY